MTNEETAKVIKNTLGLPDSVELNHEEGYVLGREEMGMYDDIHLTKGTQEEWEKEYPQEMFSTQSFISGEDDSKYYTAYFVLDESNMVVGEPFAVSVLDLDNPTNPATLYPTATNIISQK